MNAPKLVDRALGDAQGELERRGLRLGGVTLAPANDKRAGTVLAQEPAADVRMRQGESVSVTVAVPAPPTAAGQ
jgi:beta-lactam-binding protein with PASTA domain